MDVVLLNGFKAVHWGGFKGFWGAVSGGTQHFVIPAMCGTRNPFYSHCEKQSLLQFVLVPLSLERRLCARYTGH